MEADARIIVNARGVEALAQLDENRIDLDGVDLLGSVQEGDLRVGAAARAEDQHAIMLRRDGVWEVVLQPRRSHLR